MGPERHGRDHIQAHRRHDRRRLRSPSRLPGTNARRAQPPHRLVPQRRSPDPPAERRNRRRAHTTAAATGDRRTRRMTVHRCAYCGQIKPAGDFPPNANTRSGLDSWCNDCRRKYTQERWYDGRKHSPVSPHTKRITDALAGGDAISYSRAVCDHIAWYVQRKITEFEVTQQMEAPPHMTAILTIAKSISAQHPVKQAIGRAKTTRGTYTVTCTICGTEHEARSPTAKYCDGCRVKIRREQRNAQRQRWHLRPAGQAYQQLKNARRAEERAARPPVVIECQRCGIFVEAKTRHRKYCTECVDIARREYALAYNQSERGKEAMRQARRRWKAKERANLQAERVNP